ncbi:hypothetical protein GPECTOR_12g422 [Gonium pectorale]|uniref:Septin-type G domain-containing protein n=1 Tax=Gonium pectorale TaxID=33097 RepID=A0A150GNQ7_GONPE|nr:hypothetical protein GPECTOR_12g422 [Gonium pectorale]|eukprot:KXZ51459.1 hypothetical protein GPECTOR_12g422 [Gonium pectorale]
MRPAGLPPDAARAPTGPADYKGAEARPSGGGCFFGGTLEAPPAAAFRECSSPGSEVDEVDEEAADVLLGAPLAVRNAPSAAAAAPPGPFRQRSNSAAVGVRHGALSDGGETSVHKLAAVGGAPGGTGRGTEAGSGGPAPQGAIPQPPRIGSEQVTTPVGSEKGAAAATPSVPTSGSVAAAAWRIARVPCVSSPLHLNVLVAGGSSLGKTTFIHNMCARLGAPDEAAELVSGGSPGAASSVSSFAFAPESLATRLPPIPLPGTGRTLLAAFQDTPGTGADRDLRFRVVGI